MALTDVSLWPALTALLFAFAAADGLLVHRARRAPSQWRDQLGAAAFALLVLGPGFLIVLRWQSWGVPLRAATVSIGALLVILYSWRPSWWPGWAWDRKFGRRYLAATMALTGLWCAAAAATAPPLPSLLIGLSACYAGFAALSNLPCSADLGAAEVE